MSVYDGPDEQISSPPYRQEARQKNNIPAEKFPLPAFLSY